MVLQVNINLNGESLTKETLQHVHQLLLMELSSVPVEGVVPKGKVSVENHKETPQQADAPKEAESEADCSKTEVSQSQNRPQPTLPEVQAAFMELAKTKGNKEAKKLLEKHSASKVTELPEELYADALEDIKQVMGNA